MTARCAHSRRYNSAVNRKPRPAAVTLLALIYVAAGIGGFAAHFGSLRAEGFLGFDSLAVEVTEILAMVAGGFMLRGANWARWLAVAWMGFHVAISFPAIGRVAMHSVMLGAFAWILFRGDAGFYFGGQESEPRGQG
jgi:hypothetical protein